MSGLLQNSPACLSASSLSKRGGRRRRNVGSIRLNAIIL